MATTVAKKIVPQTMVSPMRRLVSLDVVRGITIAFMILVNNGGSGKYSYRQLEHSPWNGWTLTDLVVPSFLFIAGMSIVFSTESRLARGDPTNCCQSRDGPALAALEVKTSTTSPFSSLRSSATSRPLTRAPMQR